MSAETNFSSAAEIFEAGYAMQDFNIMSSVFCWRFRDERYKTLTIPHVKNRAPNVLLARIQDVRNGSLRRD